MSDTAMRLRRAAAALQKDVAALTIPERALILAESHERPISPSQLARDWGLDLKSVTRHFKAMTNAGFLEYVEEAPAAASGGHRPQRLYRATTRLLYRTEEWKNFPLEEREGHSFVVFVTYVARISQALNTGTMDAEVDRHFTWKALMLDRRAWNELVSRLDDDLDWAVELEVEAAERMRHSGEQPIPATIGLGGFRSPRASEMAVPV